MAVRPRLALVPGEPGGIGPELCVRIAQRDHGCRSDHSGRSGARAYRLRPRALNLPLRCKSPGDSCALSANLPCCLSPHRQPIALQANLIRINSATGDRRPAPRRPRRALQGKFDGLVTGPVHKAAVNAAGITYTGTTELIGGSGRRSGGHDARHRIAPRVALATTHLPLAGRA